MAHPHLKPRHLVKLLDMADRQYSATHQPEWLGALLDRLCDCIEPIRGEARVGYDLHFADPLWQLDLFLGRTELVGGRLDGRADYVSFTANIPAILTQFSKVDRCEWLALPNALDASVTEAASGLFIEGTWGSDPVRVVLRSVPPSNAAPGLRQYPDGRYELV